MGRKQRAIILALLASHKNVENYERGCKIWHNITINKCVGFTIYMDKKCLINSYIWRTSVRITYVPNPPQMGWQHRHPVQALLKRALVPEGSTIRMTWFDSMNMILEINIMATIRNEKRDFNVTIPDSIAVDIFNAVLDRKDWFPDGIVIIKN
jgi:hypothetical protein